MKIAHINDRLIDWAEWAASGRLVTGLGYASCQLTGFRTHGGFFRGAQSVDYDAGAAETDRAVTLLPPELRSLVREHYLMPGTIRQKLSRLGGISSRTFYERLYHAQLRVGQLLEAVRSDSRGGYFGSPENFLAMTA